VLVGLSLSYWALNTRGTFRFREVPGFLNYDMLADAFSQAQLHLREQVHPGRLQAADPAHPELPYPYLRDAVIFHGKYYFLQEPLPGAFHLVWMKVTGLNLQTGASVIVVALSCLVIVGIVLRIIRNSCFRDTPAWLAWAVWISFAVSGSQLYIVSRPVVYHETILWGTLFTLCAAAFFFSALLESQPAIFARFLCGLFCGLAVLSRVTCITYAVSFGLGFALTSILGKRTFRVIASELLVFAVPLICCIGTLLIYNHLRFGDLLDFGRSRVTMPSAEVYEYCCIRGNFFSLSHLKPNLRTYLCGLPDVSFHHVIPWVRFPSYEISTKGVYLWRENVASLFIMAPMFIAGIPLIVWPRFRAESSSVIVAILTCYLACLVSFSVFVPLVTAQARYLYEITALSFLVVYYNFAMLWRILRDRGGLVRFASASLAILVIVHGIMGLYLGINGMVQWR
jgi:hypothetical protein